MQCNQQILLLHGNQLVILSYNVATFNCAKTKICNLQLRVMCKAKPTYIFNIRLTNEILEGHQTLDNIRMRPWPYLKMKSIGKIS